MKSLKLWVVAIGMVAACGEKAEEAYQGRAIGTGAMAKQTIGATGGTISVEGATLTVPPGALATDTEITIVSRVDAVPAGVRRYTPVYEARPIGLQFTKPVTWSMEVTSDATEPVVYWSNAAGSDFEQVTSRVEGGKLIVENTHFSCPLGQSKLARKPACADYVDCCKACKANGASCSANAECCGLMCTGGTCKAASGCKEPGAACTGTPDCCTGTCEGNVCKPPCGMIGATCSGNMACCSGLMCGSDSKCAMPGGGCKKLGEACSAAATCCTPLACDPEMKKCKMACKGVEQQCEVPQECCSSMCREGHCT